jgi:hypothetical protein
MPLSSPAQTLPVNTGLQLWLKADAGVTTNSTGLVTKWADQSGMSNDAIQSDSTKAPTLVLNSLNGKPTLRFPGGTRYLDVADSASISALTEDVTILALVLYDDVSSYRCCVTKTVGNGPAPFDWWNQAGSAGGAANFWLGAAPSTGSYKDNVGTNPPRLGLFNVMTFSWANGAVNQYLNDRPNGTGTYSQGVPADGGKPLRIGSRDDLVTQLKGNAAEILIYQPALSDADRGAVLNYLKTKWNLNFITPPTVSIKAPANGLKTAAGSTVPVTVTASDSNTNGVVTLLSLLNNGATVASWTQPPYTLDLGLLNPGKSVLTAVAANNLGASATSGPVSITVTGAPPVLQPPSDGLQVWLKADAGVTTGAGNAVTKWADQSGNGNDATQSDATVAPVLTANVVNGQPALVFGNNTPYLTISDAATAFTTNSFTILVEAQFADFASYRQLVSKTGGALAYAAPFDWWFGPNSGVPNGFIGDGTTFTTVAATLPAVAGQFGTYGLGFDGKSLSHYLDMVTDGTGAITATPASGGNPLRIGQRDDAVTQMAGDIAEILMYKKELSATDRSNAVVYLSSKYGLAQAIIANPPVAVSITSPTNGATFATSSNVSVGIDASTAIGSIVNVQLLANDFPVVTLTNSPYRVPIGLLSPGTVSLTAVVLDNLGVTSTSAPVVLTVTGSAPTAPPSTDLRFWFSADSGVQSAADGTVTSWTDRSGNGNTANAVGSAPHLVTGALNGKPVLHFNAGDDLDVTTAHSIEFTGDISSYFVVRFGDFANYRAVWAKTQNNLPGSVDYYLLPGSGLPVLYRGNGTNSFGNVTANRGVPAGAYTVLGYEMAGPTATHYINGVAAGSGQITASIADAGTDLLIGTRADMVTQLQGDLAEVLAFGHALSRDEHAAVLSYLAGKYDQPLVDIAYLPPAVSILSPANGATVPVSTPIDFEVGVTDTNNPISQVVFFANGAVVGTATAPPYALTLNVLTPGKLTLQAQASDIWGAMTTSTPVVLTVTGQGPASPPTNGLVLWLKADKGVSTNSDGTVSAWADQSGNGNNAVQSSSAAAPSLVIDAKTGRPALQFNGSSANLGVASAPSLVIQGDISTFSAFDVADITAAHTIWSKSSNGRAYPWIYDITSGGAIAFSRGNVDGVNPVNSSTAVQPNTPVVTGVSLAGSLASHYLNAEPAGSGVFGYGALDQGTPLVIGALDDLTSPFAGTLSELLIYNRALSGDDLALANNYLAARSSITVIQVGPPTVSVSLDISKVTGSTAQISWPASANGWVLQSKAALGSGAWTPVATNPPNNTVVIGLTNAARFFRLQSQ